MKANPFDMLSIPVARLDPVRKRLDEMTKSERLEFTKANGQRGGMRSAKNKEALSRAGKLGGKARHAGRR